MGSLVLTKYVCVCVCFVFAVVVFRLNHPTLRVARMYPLITLKLKPHTNTFNGQNKGEKETHTNRRTNGVCGVKYTVCTAIPIIYTNSNIAVCCRARGRHYFVLLGLSVGLIQCCDVERRLLRRHNSVACLVYAKRRRGPSAYTKCSHAIVSHRTENYTVMLAW